MRFHLEHIRARRHGGQNSLDNLAWACPRCNERKSANLSGVDPDTGRVVRLFNPRTDPWARHFVCDGLHIAALTSIGRATAWLLEFNSDDRLDLRRGLRKLGLM